jgi:signal transduction histidine kinase
MISMWMDGDFDKMPDEQRKEMLRRIYVSTGRLNNITNDMLDALEWEGGVLKLEFKKVSVMEIVKDTMTTLKPDYDKKGLYLEFDEVDENIPDVEGEPNYLSQIFMNLVDNACKYTRTGGTKISMKKSGKYVDIYVKDTGIGMEEKDIKRAFEKFTRGENAMKENASGSGLGLFIVKKILDQHNGKITITCDGPDKGTAFKVSLLIKQE